MAGIDKTRWQTLSPLLDELLEADPHERDARLDRIRRANRGLGEELAHLLSQQAEVETAHFLEGAAFELPAEPTLVEQVVGNYTLEKPLGQGGMGSVWLARRSDGRYEGRAAVKFLNLGLLGRGGLERFQREGTVLARLAHPHIARLLDAGVLAGQPYLVLEYVEGEPIDHYCDARHLTVDARVQVFIGVLGAIEHAHTNLILHRDLKPSNILVTAQGEVKLLDFGIAKLMHERAQGAGATELTQAGGRAFTPEYAAPEQVQGDDVTTATDVYALGVLLHVLLVGSHPTAQPGRAPVEQLRALIETEPARPSDAAARGGDAVARLRAATPPQLARALRGDLDNIIAKALKKSPADRYATAAAFADDLRRYLNCEPVGARPDALAYRVRKFVRRHRVAVAAASATLVALVAGVVGTTWQAVEARRAQALAEASALEATRQKSAAEFEARVARANHEFLSQVFGDAMRGGESTRMQQRLDRAREMLRRRYANDPEVHAILLMQVAGRYAELRDDKREAEVLDEIEQLADRSGKPALQASMQCIRAYDLIGERKLDEAEPFLKRGLALSSPDNDPQGLAAFECVRADSMLAALRNDRARAQQRMTDFLASLQSSGRGRTRAYLSALGSLAHVQSLAGDPGAAIETTRRKIALDEELGSSETLATTVDFERIAILLMDLGRVADSAAADQQLVRRFTDADEQPSSSMRASLARRALLNGNTAHAVELLRDLVPHFEREGPESYARGTMLDLVDGLWQQHRGAEADAWLRRFENRLAQKPASQLETLESTRLRALLALDRGDMATARAQADSLVQALDAAPQARRVPSLKGRLAASWIYTRLGDTERALAQAQSALVLGETKTDGNQASAWVGAANLALAYAQAAGGAAQASSKSTELARTQIDASVGAEHPLRRFAALPVEVRAR
jgi:serine/threonine-protein kinase